jgi:hypothetical protein
MVGTCRLEGGRATTPALPVDQGGGGASSGGAVLTPWMKPLAP